MNTTCFSRLTGGCSLVIVLAAVLFPSPAFAQVYDPYFSAALGPGIRIVSPANHQFFLTPVNIPVLVYTRPEAHFTNLEIYANGTDIGSAMNLSTATHAVYDTLASPTVWLPGVLNRLHGVWCFEWSNAPAGAYALTVVGKGNEIVDPAISINRTTAPVNITILTSVTPPTPTHYVNIFATDPIAVAGTNVSWAWTGETNEVPSWANWPPPAWGYFTNWGPKAAMFTVIRTGDDTTNEVINYSIGGTASNGVDYVELPGTVTIASNSVFAEIPIMPLDSGSNNLAKTVVLTVQPSTNTPPDYLAGCHSRAEAIILYHWPRPLPWLLPDGAFHVSTSAPDGAWFVLEDSPDLVNWTSDSTNQAVNGSIDFADPNAPNNSSGFYQIVPLTNSPSD
jgi:hypothetical protein